MKLTELVAKSLIAKLVERARPLHLPPKSSLRASSNEEIRDWNAGAELGLSQAELRTRFGYPKP